MERLDGTVQLTEKAASATQHSRYVAQEELSECVTNAAYLGTVTVRIKGTFYIVSELPHPCSHHTLADSSEILGFI